MYNKLHLSHIFFETYRKTELKVFFNIIKKFNLDETLLSISLKYNYV